MKTKTILSSTGGHALVLFAAMGFAMIGFAAISIDIGYVLTADHQLQNAIDASALAGASGLIYSRAEATNRAIQYAGLNQVSFSSASITASDISFPTSSRIRVEKTRTVNLFFGRALGVNTSTIHAAAVAELGLINGTGNLKPWAIPDLQWTIGAPVVLKAGELGAPATNPGFFYPVDFPPLELGTPVPGAQEYLDNIVNGSDYLISIGQTLLVEPGNMVGPTAQGVNDLISLDPNAYWDGSGVAGSDYAGFSSPRIIKVPLYDPNYPPDSGRNTVQITKLGAFFIEGISGRNVTGRFIEITTAGNPGSSSSMLKSVRLVQ